MIISQEFMSMSLLKIFTPMATGKPINEEKLAEDFEKFDKILGTIEEKFLGGKEYLCADKISIADICAITEVRNCGSGWGGVSTADNVSFWG